MRSPETIPGRYARCCASVPNVTSGSSTLHICALRENRSPLSWHPYPSASMTRAVVTTSAARPAQLGGNRQALDPELGTPAPRLPRELPGILALHQILVELPPGEVRRRLGQLTLLGAQREVHAAPLAVRQPPAGRPAAGIRELSRRAAKLHHGNLVPRQYRHLLRHDVGAADVVAQMGGGGTRHEPPHNQRQ